MMNFMIAKEACKKQAGKALNAFGRSSRIHAMGDKIVLPDEIAGWCVKMKMPIGERTLGVSFSISPDRCGNQADDIGPDKPPSTLEILLMGSDGDFSDLDRHLGFNGDIRDFHWDATPGAPEGGFAEVIDELVRIRAVLDGDLSASLADSSADHEEVDDADDEDADDDDADDDDADLAELNQARLDELEQVHRLLMREKAAAAVVEVKQTTQQARMDELEQIFLRGLELIHEMRGK